MTQKLIKLKLYQYLSLIMPSALVWIVLHRVKNEVTADIWPMDTVPGYVLTFDEALDRWKRMKLSGEIR